MATNRFWRDGEPFVWAMAGALCFILMITILLIVVVMKNGLGVFWPAPVAEVQLTDGTAFAGEIVRRQSYTDRTVADADQAERQRLQLKVGNREFGMDFRWVMEDEVAAITYPEGYITLERQEYGNFYGRLLDMDEAQFDTALAETRERLAEVREFQEGLNALSKRMDSLRQQIEVLEYKGLQDDHPELRALAEAVAKIQRTFEGEVDKQSAMLAALREHKATFETGDGRTKEIILAEIVRYTRPNQMGFFSKVWHYLVKVRELLLDEPRESNTEGGLFPAIFGTVLMVFLMSALSFPLGVIAGIYLREYAKEGLLVRTVRIAVNNLAGIPSIVYGIFGLGFFVYGMGGTIDHLFFPERLPTPTFGTGGILWASLTLGLLTVPVVIVSTEEALGQISKGIREGSLALGATKFQTLCRVLLPMASPGIMTGFILAMARAAGEVAPLMITGVVKIAPSLPIDGEFPFFHLERKFMHLGFHIYDIGFQSPNVEAAKPMVFVTTFLLVLIVLVMSSLAIYLRNIMLKRYQVRGI